MDGEQLAALYRRYGYCVFRRCVAYLGVNDAPEAMRAVFVRALQASRGLGPQRGQVDPRTWLCRISDELCAELLRAHSVDGTVPALRGGAIHIAPALRGGAELPAAVNTEASGFVPMAPSASAGDGGSVRSSSVPGGISQAEAEALERAVAADDLDALFAVQRLLPRLPAELRRLAVLYYLDELTEEELAHELDWSRRTVSKRLQLLLDQARALWRERAAS
jgi:RNA polymerase sigma factor (sigma-70 family)